MRKEKNIKILHIITRLVQGGAQKDVLLKIKYLVERGFDVYLVSGPTSGPEGHVSLEEIKDKIKLFTIPELIRKISPFKDLVALIKLYLFIKRNNFDIVHTHTSKAGVLGRLAARFAKIPIIIHTPHGNFFYGYFNFFTTKFFIFLEKIMSFFTDRIITLTEIGREEHIKFGIGRRNRFTVIPEGIDIDKFISCDVKKSEICKELGIPSNVPLIGIVARLVTVKGHRYLLDAFKRILERRRDTRLLIIGDGVLKEDLKVYCKRNGIADNVIFTGLRYDIPRILSILDVVTLTSLNEGLGIALLEAMIMKKPVVASNIGGIPEIVEDGVVGYLVSPRDSITLADKILKIIQNPRMAKTMGENGFRKVISSFSIKKKAKELEELYNDLLEKKTCYIKTILE